MYRYNHLNKSSLESSIFLKSIKGGPETTKCESHRPGPQSIPRTVPTSVLSTGYGAKHTRPPFRYQSTPLDVRFMFRAKATCRAPQRWEEAVHPAPVAVGDERC